MQTFKCIGRLYYVAKSVSLFRCNSVIWWLLLLLLWNMIARKHNAFVNHKASPKNHRCWFAVAQNFKVLLTNSIGSIIIMTTTWINSNLLAPEKTAVNNKTLINHRLKSLFLSKDYRTVEGMKILDSRIHQTIPPLYNEAEF